MESHNVGGIRISRRMLASDIAKVRRIREVEFKARRKAYKKAERDRKREERRAERELRRAKFIIVTIK